MLLLMPSLVYSAIGLDNGLSPAWHQAIIWTKVGLLWLGVKETQLQSIEYFFH